LIYLADVQPAVHSRRVGDPAEISPPNHRIPVGITGML
jgi:hypothetical protein